MAGLASEFQRGGNVLQWPCVPGQLELEVRVRVLEHVEAEVSPTSGSRRIDEAHGVRDDRIKADRALEKAQQSIDARKVSMHDDVRHAEAIFLHFPFEVRAEEGKGLLQARPSSTCRQGSSGRQRTSTELVIRGKWFALFRGGGVDMEEVVTHAASGVSTAVQPVYMAAA